MWYTYVMGLSNSHKKELSTDTKKKNEVLVQAMKYMSLESIMLGERTLSQKITYCIIPVI